MKKFLLSSLFLIFAATFASAQIVTIPAGHISTNTTWTNDNIYRLDGFVYVDSLATLTIEPGTIIRGVKATKGSLIVTRGGKLMAEGTSSAPIVFTSDEAPGTRTYGDWGGIIILGAAKVNPVGGQAIIEGGVNNANGDGQYGGTNDDDNSGILRFVRIEYSGIPLSANNEINGLTMGGVGRGTVIENVMVSFNGDDAFEWFGGTVNCKNLIAYKVVDDDFDTDFGFRGKVQFGLVVRDKDVADQAGDSNGFESDNDNTGTNQALPKTNPFFSNITVVGPKADAGTVINAKYNNALRLRRNTATSVYNSIFMGYATGLYVEGDSAANNATTNQLEFRNSIIAGCATPLKKTTASFDIDAWFNTPAYANSALTNNTDVLLTAPYAAIPNCLPAVGSPALTGADFTNPRLQDSFFDSVGYKGAFGVIDWTSGWANWDPQNTNYNTLPVVAGFTFVNGASGMVTFTNSSTNASTYAWTFGDGGVSTDENPVHTYTANGKYEVVLTASNGTDINIFSDSVTVTGIVGINNTKAVNSLVVYPNPVSERATIKFNVDNASAMSVNVYNIQGKLVATLAENKMFAAGVNTIDFNAADLKAGIYTVKFQSSNAISSERIAIVK
jgi:hypothetical protein